MKTLVRITVLTSIAALLSLQLYSQNKPTVVVSADSMKILYLGIDNPVSITACGIDNDKLDVCITNGEITGRHGKYIIRPGSGKITQFIIAAEDKSGEIKYITTDTFRVKKIPSPIACIGSNCSSSLYLSKAELLRNPKLNILWYFPMDLDFKVISYSFTYAKDKDIYVEKAKGCELTSSMIDEIKSMEGGSKIFLEDIKVMGPDDTIRSLESIVIKLTDKG